ncbi:hypothetical protein FO440_22535 [Mucilaginibacter corticis]|uniref:Right-handed parallel beta-helix repeat-containing protein n=1 Tax=Mucilaginibacter corticis TaxID=2597670 RepID=A0A556M9L8_9SPHI|nr:hypothetical protein [Mucilaginibacter corticis]TSJ36607.1 hypothetical protein FO440_22535 [Mucilaginibacter corticis]
MNLYTSLKFAFLLLFIFLSTALLAGTKRVNNTLATDKTKNIFATLQEAHDAAAGGDTLLVEGTIKPYALLNCSKPLVIIGTGFFLTQNGGQANALSAVVNQINFNSGSEGSAIIGLLFLNTNSNNCPYVAVDGISIIRCYLANGILITGNITSLIVIQNYITGPINVYNSNLTLSGAILKNNIIDNGINVSSSPTVPRVFAIVEHNIFTNVVTLSTSSFRSNILTSTAVPTITSSAIQNNLTLGTQFNSIATNQSYGSSDKLFVGVSASNNSPDGQYKIVAGSAFAKAGYNGEEPGVFGSAAPYVLSGIPPIPSVYELQADAVASKADGLNVTIKARANQ